MDGLLETGRKLRLMHFQISDNTVTMHADVRPEQLRVNRLLLGMVEQEPLTCITEKESTNTTRRPITRSAKELTPRSGGFVARTRLWRACPNAFALQNVKHFAFSAIKAHPDLAELYVGGTILPEYDPLEIPL